MVDITPGVDGHKASAITAFIDGPASFESFDELLARTIAFNPTRSSRRCGGASCTTPCSRTTAAGCGATPVTGLSPGPAEGGADSPRAEDRPLFGSLWDAVSGLEARSCWCGDAAAVGGRRLPTRPSCGAALTPASSTSRAPATAWATSRRAGPRRRLRGHCLGACRTDRRGGLMTATGPAAPSDREPADDPIGVVRAFLAALEALDVDAALALASPDIVYQNVPRPRPRDRPVRAAAAPRRAGARGSRRSSTASPPTAGRS